MHLRGDLYWGGQRRRFPAIGLMVFLPFWLFNWSHQQAKFFDFWRVLVVVTVVLMASCSNPPDSSSETLAEGPSQTTSPPGPGSMSVREGQDRGGQVLEGLVLFEGSNIPRSTRVQNTTDPQDCEPIQSLSNIIISRENRGIKNVILALKGVPLPKDYRPQPSPLILDNRDCQFEPHVGVLTPHGGSSIEAVNRDPIFHSVHLYGFLNLNLALGPNQAKVAQTVERPGYVIVTTLEANANATFMVGCRLLSGLTIIPSTPLALQTAASGSRISRQVPTCWRFGTNTLEKRKSR